MTCEFDICRKDSVEYAVTYSNNWAEKIAGTDLPQSIQALSDNPYWFERTSYSNSAEFYPYGRIEISNQYDQLMNDGNPSYNYWLEKVQVTSVPGKFLDWHGGWLGDHWVTIRQYESFDVDNDPVAPSAIITDVGPGDSPSQTAITYSLGVEGPSVSRSYSLSDVTIDENYLQQYQWVEWYQEILWKSTPSQTTYIIKPPLQVRTLGYNPYCEYNACYQVKWRTDTSWAGEEHTSIFYLQEWRAYPLPST